LHLVSYTQTPTLPHKTALLLHESPARKTTMFGQYLSDLVDCRQWLLSWLLDHGTDHRQMALSHLAVKC